MENLAVPDFLLKKSQTKPRIEFWGQRKGSNPATMTTESKSKFIELLDKPKPNPLQTFYSKSGLKQIVVHCHTIRADKKSTILASLVIEASSRLQSELESQIDRLMLAVKIYG